MADTNKLVTMIALIIIGLIIAIWGVIYMWLHRNDRQIIEESLGRGEISAADAARLSSPTWWWVLSIVQIIVGIGLIIWGIFQNFSGVQQVVTRVKEGFVPGVGPVTTETITTTTGSPVATTMPRNVGGTSRRMNGNGSYGF